MALSGTIWGSFTAMSTSKARPYITWSATQNIGSNTSTVTATLYFIRYDGYRSWDNNGKSFTVTIDGTNTTQTKPFDFGPNSKVDTIITASKTITHDGDGRKSITIKASGNTGLSNLGSVSISQTITLDTIPRASDFTAFSLSNATLNTSTATTINYTLSRKSSSFSQAMTLKYGGTTIASWSTTGSGALTRTLSATEVNKIISAMPTRTSGTLSLTMQTKSGSSNIGSSVTRNITVSLNSAIKPSASGMSVSIYGSGRDKTINKYVQGVTRVTASFTRSAGYGATIASSSIVVRRVSGAANSQTIGSHSGTTSSAVSLSGSYEAIGTVKDSRGRSNTVRATFTVEAYAAPKINTFTANRHATTRTTVTNPINVTWSALGGSNAANITVVGIRPGASSTTMYTSTGNTTGSLSTTRSYTGQGEAYTYTYTITVTDSFGKKATAVQKVGTSFIELTISKGKGIGVGKVHERGSLDITGPMFINNVNRTFADTLPPKGDSSSLAYWHSLEPGTYIVTPDTIVGQPSGYGFMEVTRKSGISDFSVLWYVQSGGDIYRLSGNGSSLRPWQKLTSAFHHILWSGGAYMHGGQTLNMPTKLSDCANGWILVWADYSNGAGQKYDNVYTYVHKSHIDDRSGQGVHFVVSGGATTGNTQLTTKYVYVSNDKLEGNAVNDGSTLQKNIVLVKVVTW